MAYIITNDGYYQGLFPQYGFGFFAADNSVRFYCYSLYWLVRYAGLGDVGAEIQKDGEPLLYGRLSADELDRLVAEGRLKGLKRHSWGISWDYKNQDGGGGMACDFDSYTEWRNTVLEDTTSFLYGPQDYSDNWAHMIWWA